MHDPSGAKPRPRRKVDLDKTLTAIAAELAAKPIPAPILDLARQLQDKLDETPPRPAQA